MAESNPPSPATIEPRIPSEHSQVTPRRPTLKALTTLRFFAAFHVVLFHVGRNHIEGSPAWLRNLVMSGFTGVSLFFVLSGFILAYNYLDRSPDGHVDKREFWGARFARIYPVYVVGLILALPIFIKEVLAWRSQGLPAIQPAMTVPATAILVQAWTPLFQPALNALGWTLSVEAFFYALFPTLVWRFAKLQQGGILGWIAGLCALMAAPVVVFQMLNPSGLASLTDQRAYVTAWAIQGNPIGRLPEFLMGMCLGKLFLIRRAERTPSRTTTIWTLIAVAGILLIGCLADPERAKLWYAPMLDPFYLLLIYTLAKAEGPIARFLSVGFLVLFGEASYALYIVHTSFALYFFDLLKGHADISSPIWFLAYSAAVVGFCCLLFVKFETPARRWIRGRLTA